MGMMNWPVAVLAAVVAALVLFSLGERRGGMKRAAMLLAAMLVAAAMLGHSFARIGAVTLAAKPWLYPMQSGGLALAFVIPALWINGVRMRQAVGWLAAYLAMGGVFWLLG